MSKARDLGNLLDTDGDVVSGSLDNVPTPSKTSIEALGIALPADNLTGSIAEARFPSTALNSNLITKSTSEPTISTNPSGGVGTTWLRTTTGEMYCCTDATSGANVWTNIGDGTDDIAPWTGMVATGGTITTDGDYKVHTFNSGATFEVTTLGHGEVEYLVIAGGAGGGGVNGGNWGGGGGAGGYRTATGFSVTATTYSITVGAGGAVHVDGSNSVFSSITSTGGGRGGHGTESGNSGGSGGGGGGGAGGTGGSGGAASPAGQGNNGGAGLTTYNAAGGGGGAGGSGGAAVSSNGGAGGSGLASSITGSSITRGGGGGGSSGESGGAEIHGAGGSGGGGAGGDNNGSQRPATGEDGTANKGGGAGGGSWSGSGYVDGGAGGSGVVIIRYKFQ